MTKQTEDEREEQGARARKEGDVRLDISAKLLPEDARIGLAQAQRLLWIRERAYLVEVQSVEPTESNRPYFDRLNKVIERLLGEVHLSDKYDPLVRELRLSYIISVADEGSPFANEEDE